MNYAIISSVLAVTSGFILNIYNGVSEKRGYPVCKFFLHQRKWLLLISWLMIIPGGIELFSQLGGTIGMFSILFCFIGAMILISKFKANIQWMSLLMACTSIIIWIIGGIRIVEY